MAGDPAVQGESTHPVLHHMRCEVVVEYTVYDGDIVDVRPAALWRPEDVERALSRHGYVILTHAHVHLLLRRRAVSAHRVLHLLEHALHGRLRPVLLPLPRQGRRDGRVPGRVLEVRHRMGREVARRPRLARRRRGPVRPYDRTTVPSTAPACELVVGLPVVSSHAVPSEGRQCLARVARVLQLQTYATRRHPGRTGRAPFGSWPRARKDSWAQKNSDHGWSQICFTHRTRNSSPAMASMPLLRLPLRHSRGVREELRSHIRVRARKGMKAAPRTP